MDLQKTRLGVIGGGIMAENIVRGIITAGLLPPESITVSDINADRCALLQKKYSVTATRDNRKTIGSADVIILAVKPQNMKGLLEDIADVADDTKLFLSIAAGVTTAAIAKALSGNGRIIRIMPNTAARVLQSASALCLGPAATAEDLARAQKIFGAIGKTVVINEELMDAVTGVSGSGPAYIFLVIEALADAGVKAGLTRQTAQELAAQTCLGAAQLVLSTGEHPGVLKDQVTSPAGTTICALHELEKNAVRGSFIDAVQAAVTRAKQLGES